jgi:hypothetical protein
VITREKTGDPVFQSSHVAHGLSTAALEYWVARSDDDAVVTGTALPTGTFYLAPGYLPALGTSVDTMSDSYIIEVGSRPAGIVVRSREGFRFFAASRHFNRLEGQLFRNAREAERAARRLAEGDEPVAA